MMEIKNAKVIDRDIVLRGHHLCINLMLTYGGTNQGWTSGRNLEASLLGLMEVMGVTEWGDVLGTTLRVECDDKGIYRFGHLLENLWFNPKELK